VVGKFPDIRLQTTFIFMGLRDRDDVGQSRVINIGTKYDLRLNTSDL
jgi:hypothetical protein